MLRFAPLVLVALLTTSCEGPIGPVGPTGPSQPSANRTTAVRRRTASSPAKPRTREGLPRFLAS